MSNTYNGNISFTIFGQSHSPCIGIVIYNFPSGVKIDENYIANFMKRRAPGGAYATPRKEDDKVTFISGLNENGETCGAPICAIINNNNIKSKDYDNIKLLPRPSHCDLTALFKYGESRDVRGGGQFSGRLTAPLCILGAMCKQLLEKKGIFIGAHLSSVGGENDISYNMTNDVINDNQQDFPSIDYNSAEKMKKVILNAQSQGDSVGATIECKIVGVPKALGEPPFDGIENQLAKMMFSIPAVKGFEIGSGFNGSKLFGSENNDELCVKGNEIKTVTNNAGGVLGGITNGMPIVFKVAVKPTPSISKPQQSVNVKTMQVEQLIVKGRHDPCVGVRAVPVVEAASAIVLFDMIKENKGN